MLYPPPSSSVHVMIAHPQPEALAWLSEFLIEQGYQVEWVTDLAQVLPLVEAVDPSLIILEVGLSSFLSLDACGILSSHPEYGNIPILAINSSGAAVDRIKVFEAGVRDYLVSHSSLIELRVKVESYIDHQRIHQENRTLNELLAMFGAIDELIIVFNPDGECIKVAPTQYAMQFNHFDPHSSYLNDKIQSLLPPELVNLKRYWTRYVIEHQETIENLEYCWPIQEKDYWFMGTISPLTQNTAIWVCRDITDQKESEKKLGLLERAIAASTNGIIISDSTKPGNPIVYVNPGFEKLTGYTEAEILGRTCSILQGEDRDQPDLALLRQALKEKKNCQVTLKNYRKDGTVFWNDLSLSPVFNEQQKLLYYIGVQTDVTDLKLAKDRLNEQYRLLQQEIEERKRIELALRESETKYRQLVDCANSLIIKIDRQGNILFFNEFAQNFFGYTEAEILGKNIKGTIVPVKDTEGHTLYPIIDDILEHTEKYRIYENENQLKNGDRVWIEWTNRILYHESGEAMGILSVGMDATARKQTQIALQSAKQAAEIANQTKSQFIARMSHELRTPLNAILGFTQIVKREVSLTSEYQEYLNIINRSGEHLLELINDILSLSKIEAGKISLEETCFNLYRLVDEVKDVLKLKADEKGLVISVTLAPNVPSWVITDQGKLRQILMNLLSNSLKFTHIGEVHLRVFPTPDRQHPLIQDYIWEVQDTGEGIASEELPLLFEPFMQTTSGLNSGQGTGLGLTICKQLLQLMGGNIWVSSEVGVGTLVSFQIPLRTAQPEEIPKQIPEKQAIALAPNQPAYRILVVDDHWENRRLLLKQLQPLGFQVLEAENGQQALELWRNGSPDLIWMDLRMPVMDGYSAARSIRQQEQQETSTSAIPILALTASALEEDQALIEEAGCNELVHKPVSQAVLLEKIRDYLGVEYIYTSSHTEENMEHRVHPTDGILSGEQLMGMPIDWLMALHQGATEADEDSISKLLQEIPDTQSNLREAIAGLLHDYRLDRILDATVEAIEALR
ncbi:PAS domain S-box protein [Roseofilum capinflatum]|uniref:histidine kinase n=1 Tax=Roseofilum capinflatum BLCC-M114 TaxID=3022440 RepID=A0ABT7B287_9CYAN|nr:PAS domain S-box protein [Roseofilum capinflatum]MDJ1173260.1 PAS domain S-box protein [Roseofilum capinflatum BLCC-M114]